MAYVKVKSSEAIEKLTIILNKIKAETEACKAAFARPFYQKEWSWKYFKKVEVKSRWSSWSYSMYTEKAYGDGIRVLNLIQLCKKADFVYFTEEDVSLMNGNYARIHTYNALPHNSYYKD